MVSYVSQEHTLLWSAELYALRVPPMWDMWVFLLWQADYCGWPRSTCLPGLALCGGCQLLMSRARFRVGGGGAGGPGSSISMLVGGASS